MLVLIQQKFRKLTDFSLSESNIVGFTYLFHAHLTDLGLLGLTCVLDHTFRQRLLLNRNFQF